ncbi:MAG: hypothetical protein AAF690_11630 [Acidobacteriota bacterium]
MSTQRGWGEAELPRRVAESFAALKWAATLFLMLPLSLTAQSQPDELDVFDEELAVVEHEIVVEFPDLGGSAENLTAEDLLVAEGGEERQIVGLSPLDPERPYDVRIVFDQVLSADETLLLARRALERDAARIAKLGPVSVSHLLDVEVIHETVTRNTFDLEETLARAPSADQSAGWRIARTEARRASFDETPDAEAMALGAARTRQQATARLLHRLESLAVTGCKVPPCLLILVSDGFMPNDSAVSGVDPEELGRLLAAYEWTVLALPISEPDKDGEEVRRPGFGTDFETYIRSQGGVSIGRSQTGSNSRLASLDPSGYDVYVLPRYQALRGWVQATGGGILSRAEQVGPELRRFGNRYRLRYLAETSERGALLPLTVEFSEGSPFLARRRLARAMGFAKEETQLRAPAYARRGWPSATSVWLHDIGLVLRSSRAR